MAIIYSYSKTNEVYGSDLLVLSRFHTVAHEDNGRNYSLDIGTLGSYISDNYSNTLDQVLTAGNESLLEAKVGKIGIWDEINNAYGSIEGYKNRINFFGSIGGLLGYFGENIISIYDTLSSFSFYLTVPEGLESDKSVTFQDKSGTIALISDITNTGSGLYSQISDSNMVTNTTTKTILTGTGVGELEVPANTFSVGDSYEINLIGGITCTNSATLRITLENTEGVVFGDTGIMDLSSATGKNWFLDAIFTIRSIGGEGTANVICGGNFSYNVNSGNSSESFSFASTNNSDFDTTISNTLIVFVQWGAASTNDKVVSFIFNLNKIY